MVSPMEANDSRQVSERMQKEAAERDAHERDNKLKSFKGERLTPHSPSDFHHHGIDALRKMIENAKPDTLETAGDHWRKSADLLGGHDGQGGIRKKFMDAVDHATAHWEGSAADAFRKEATKVLNKIDKTYRHARRAEASLIGSRESGPEVGLAHNLRQAVTAMSKIHNPGKWDRFTDDSGDDSQFHRDMANPKMDARQALELNRDKLSLTKERQVEAVIVMDELAHHYTGRAKIWIDDGDDGLHGDWPKDPSNTPHPPPVRMPDTADRFHPDPSSVTPHHPNGAAWWSGPGRIRRPQDQSAGTPGADRTRQRAGQHDDPALGFHGSQRSPVRRRTRRAWRSGRWSGRRDAAGPCRCARGALRPGGGRGAPGAAWYA